MDKVLILGGAGRVGQFMAGLLKPSVDRLVVIDLIAPPGKVEHRVMSALELPCEDPELLRDASMIVFALPENAALAALDRLAADCRGKLLINTCSVQVPFQSAVQERLPGAPSVGINPMFSPSLDHRGRPVALCEANPTPAGDALVELLTGNLMTVRRLTPTEHDRVMALCQALPHAAILAFAMTLSRCECDLQVLEALAPPPMKTLLALVARMLQNDPLTYWDIQKCNASAQTQRDQLIANLEQLTVLSHQPTVFDFEQELEGVRQLLGEYASSYGETCANIFDLLGASGRNAACQK